MPQLEAAEKLSGSAQYIADLYRPGMLHGAIVQSTHAHARIRGYDVSAAMALKGVRAIVTGDDLDDSHHMGAFIKDEPAFAKGKVRYVGEIVAGVAADTVEIARAAARLIRIDYEVLRPVLDPADALQPDAALVHDDAASYPRVFDSGTQGNLCSRTSYRQGDVERAWSGCDLIVEDHFETQAQAHLSLEPCGALAEVDASGRVTLWSANQSVFRIQASVCESLGLSMTKLRCLTPRIGAGFGNKMEAHVQPLVVLLAMKARRPVKLILSREEDFETVRARHPFRIRMKTGVRNDGTLVARETELLLDGGAYGDDSPGVLGYALLMNCGPYRIPNVHAHGQVAYTNKMRFGAMRGFGVPQVTFASEQQLDTIARKLGMDPLAFKRKNMMVAGDPWFGSQQVRSNGLADCLDVVERESGIAAARSANPRSAAQPGRRRGFGVALTAHISGLLSSGAIVRVLEDGTVLLNTGAVDIGQGSNTVLSQICAQSLKVPLERVAIASPDTDGSPYNWGTTASRVTYVTGRSVAKAAAEVEKKLKEHASEMLECGVDDLELLPGGNVAVKGSSATLGQLRGDFGSSALGGGRADHRHRCVGLRPEDFRPQALDHARIAVRTDRHLQLRGAGGRGRSRRRNRARPGGGRMVRLRPRLRHQSGHGCRSDRRRVRAGDGLRAGRRTGVGWRAAGQSQYDGLQDSDHGRVAGDFARLSGRVGRAERAVRGEERRRNRHQRGRRGDCQRRQRCRWRSPAPPSDDRRARAGCNARGRSGGRPVTGTMKRTQRGDRK